MSNDKFARLTRLPDGRYREGLNRSGYKGYRNARLLTVVCGACGERYDAYRTRCPHCGGPDA